MTKERYANVNFWREIITVSRFALVGIIATAVHITIVWIVLTQLSLTPILANTLAFTIAFGISFLGNYLWTFSSPGSPRRAMFRFILISGSAFVVNTSILTFLVQGGWFSAVASAIISASAIPVISFAFSRFWGFKSS